MTSRIGIIGSGVVGQTLANGFVAHGYEVTIGTNSPGKRDELRTKTHGKATVGSFEDAARFGDTVVVATKGSAAESAVKAAGVSHLSGKTVIDTTNPLADAPPVNGVLHYFTAQNDSLMERLQRLAPDAHFVKAFSCAGNALMVNPVRRREAHDVHLRQRRRGETAGGRYPRAIGFEVADMGAVEGARAIEPLCMLWCIPGFLQNRWTDAFKLLAG
jgi:8-hydroxy-5-deazaflavin:NADPH oxidoreductase